MKPAQSGIRASINNVVNSLSGYPDSSCQFGVRHFFLFITRRRFSCDTNSFFFSIKVLFKYLLIMTPLDGACVSPLLTSPHWGRNKPLPSSPKGKGFCCA